MTSLTDTFEVRSLRVDKPPSFCGRCGWSVWKAFFLEMLDGTPAKTEHNCDDCDLEVVREVLES